MKQIEGYNGHTRNLSETEWIDYSLWVDTHGKLYIRLDHYTGTGSHSKAHYPVSDYADRRHGDDEIKHLRGYNQDGIKLISRPDSNDPGFFKAALRDLLPDAD